jgi:hypothetical protein
MNGNMTDATHTIQVVLKQAGDLGATRLQDLMDAPLATQPTMICAVCGTVVLVPDGNLRNHIVRRADELGGNDAIVAFEFIHEWNTVQPRGTGKRLIEERLGQSLTHIDNLNDAEVFINPDPTNPPEKQSERIKLRDLFKKSLS